MADVDAGTLTAGPIPGCPNWARPGLCGLCLAMQRDRSEGPRSAPGHLFPSFLRLVSRHSYSNITCLL